MSTSNNLAATAYDVRGLRAQARMRRYVKKYGRSSGTFAKSVSR